MCADSDANLGTAGNQMLILVDSKAPPKVTTLVGGEKALGIALSTFLHSVLLHRKFISNFTYSPLDKTGPWRTASLALINTL